MDSRIHCVPHMSSYVQEGQDRCGAGERRTPLGQRSCQLKGPAAAWFSMKLEIQPVIWKVHCAWFSSPCERTEGIPANCKGKGSLFFWPEPSRGKRRDSMYTAIVAAWGNWDMTQRVHGFRLSYFRQSKFTSSFRAQPKNNHPEPVP